MANLFSVGQTLFLSEDARLWFHDIGVRPGKVVAMSSGIPCIEFYGINARIWVNPRNLEEP